MPSERLIRAVLATIDAWIDALDDLYSAATVPMNRAKILHLKMNMLMSKISFMRLVNAPDAEIQAALARANDHATRPVDGK
jgi:hypothetical protein